MKSDSTPASTTSSKETPSKSLFSNSAALSTPPLPPQIVAASKTFPFEINDIKTAESSLKVPSSSSALTANETSVKTPKSVETPPIQLPLFHIPANSGIPYFEDSNRHFSNVSKKALEKKQRPNRPSQIRSNTKPFLQKIVGNLSQIEDDHLNEISWIRKLSNQKWISFLDIVLGGLTLLFFTIAFYFIFHVNPTLEMKLSPEFKAKIRTMLNGKNFQNCNHFSWIQTTKKETTVENSIAPIIDDSRCFTKYQNGRSFFETYKSSTPNSSDGGCNIDRVEIRPCYNESNPMNIFGAIQ
uniref:Uncharacterized protein n=1 Tax=Panagrolaimus sp. PS1159 TaxID=55785 RepID=A0AC35EWH6_9BILA